MPVTPNEAVYDEQISPLMEQIIAICHEHKLPMVMDFDLGMDDEEGSHLHCTTVVEPEHGDERIQEAAKAVQPKKHSLSMITVKDGDGQVTSMTAFVD
jgi:hypothetical protein